jgi:hypothetical protein
MKIGLCLLALFLTACGVETSGTALTAATIKKQELEAAKKTMEQAQQKIEQSVEQMQQRSTNADEATSKP